MLADDLTRNLAEKILIIVDSEMCDVSLKMVRLAGRTRKLFC